MKKTILILLTTFTLLSCGTSKTNYYILSYDEAKKTAVMREEKTTTSKSIKLTDEQFKKVKETGVKKYVKLKLTK